jgi:pimeloyl-ACP methyl ester carboxylesterase
LAKQERLPIIYLRGYAGMQNAVETTVDDPFYGFNSGSTHVRIGPRNEAVFFAFESPVVRLMGDHEYRDVYGGGSQPETATPEGTVPSESIWIYRYYDITSRTFDQAPPSAPPVRGGTREEIEMAAEELRRLIAQIRRLTVGHPKVMLVAHSTGGLIARCLIQKIYPDIGVRADEHIDKVFTYGTPHGGIHFGIPFGDALEWLRDKFGANNSDDFGRERMYAFLTPSAAGSAGSRSFDPRDLTGFDPKRFFCLVGTNARDYEVANGMSRRVVGPRSDGLVQIESAYLHNAPRAYVNRAHSGRYGLVNSEEGYQNLQRFLFGDIRVLLSLNNLDYVELGRVRELGTFHQVEVQVAVRGLPVLMHDQMTAHYSAIPVEWEKKKEGEPITLFEVFLISEKAPDKQTCRYAIRLAIHRSKNGSDFTDHLEQIPAWTDSLIADVRITSEGEASGRYNWVSEDGQPSEQEPLQRTLNFVALPNKNVEVRIGLPEAARPILGPSSEIVMSGRSRD